MKIVLILLGSANGLYMLADGLYVLIKRKFIGAQRPGPWAALFYKLDIDVYKLGPMFIIFGLCWLTFIFSLITDKSWAYGFGLAISLLTLWYLPLGSLISLIILIMLFRFKSELGL